VVLGEECVVMLSLVISWLSFSFVVGIWIRSEQVRIAEHREARKELNEMCDSFRHEYWRRRALEQELDALKQRGPYR
jgi:hypothetical protein